MAIAAENYYFRNAKGEFLKIDRFCFCESSSKKKNLQKTTLMFELCLLVSSVYSVREQEQTIQYLEPLMVGLCLLYLLPFL